MEKIRLGKTEMMVSRLGFGGIPIQRVSEDDAVAVVRRCLELGITFLDSANAYSTSEERIGKAISGRRSSVCLATKSHARTREGVEKHLKQSLKQLAVDYIDLYQFHDVSSDQTLQAVLAPNGLLALVEDAKKAGLVKHIGFSSHQIDIARKAVQTDRFETVLFPLNFVTSEAAEDLLPLAREHDVGFIVMKPMAGGMLRNATISFKYLLQFPDVVTIVGIERIPEIEEIMAVLKGPPQMNRAEKLEMKRLKKELGATFCHRCDYCQPCTQGIPISMVMTAKSFFNRLPPQNMFSGMIAEAMEKAAACTECGDCEPRCPYHLPIREMIAAHYAMYQEEKRLYQDRMSSK